MAMELTAEAREAFDYAIRESQMALNAAKEILDNDGSLPMFAVVLRVAEAHIESVMVLADDRSGVVF